MGRLTVRFAEIDGSTLIDFMPEIFSKDSSGVYMSSYSLGFPTVRESMQPAPGRNGEYDLTTLFGSRTFTANVKVFDTLTATRHEIADFIRNLCRPDRRIYVYIQQDGWSTERRMQLRGQPVAGVIDRMGGIYDELSLSWNCATGVLEGQQETAWLHPDAIGTGLTFPITYPISWVAGGDTSLVISVTNAGTVPAEPIFRIYGDCSNPIVRNGTTGAELKFTDLYISEGHYLEINSGARTVYMDSNPALSFYGKINWTASSWWTLQPGTNNISLAATGAGASCALQVIWRASWI